MTLESAIYLFGPGWFLAGVSCIFVMVQLLLLCRSGVLLQLLLLLLLLERNKVSSLLMQLSLQPLRLPLLLQLLAFILLTTEIEKPFNHLRLHKPDGFKYSITEAQ